MENLDAFFPELVSDLNEDEILMCTDPELVDPEFVENTIMHEYDPPVKDLEEIGTVSLLQLDVENTPLFLQTPTIEATSSLASSGTITITNPITYYFYLPAITHDWSPPECPNGVVEMWEECDDGNWINTDACITDEPDLMCVEAFCGDGYVWEGHEECDNVPNCNDSCEWILPPTATPTEEPTIQPTATTNPRPTATPFDTNIYISGVVLEDDGDGIIGPGDSAISGVIVYAGSPCQNTYDETDKDGYFDVNVNGDCDADGDGNPDSVIPVEIWGDAGALGYGDVLIPVYEPGDDCRDGRYCLDVEVGFPYTGKDFLYEGQGQGGSNFNSQTLTPQLSDYFSHYYGITSTPTPIPTPTPQPTPVQVP